MYFFQSPGLASSSTGSRRPAATSSCTGTRPGGPCPDHPAPAGAVHRRCWHGRCRWAAPSALAPPAAAASPASHAHGRCPAGCATAVRRRCAASRAAAGTPARPRSSSASRPAVAPPAGALQRTSPYRNVGALLQKVDHFIIEGQVHPHLRVARRNAGSSGNRKCWPNGTLELTRRRPRGSAWALAQRSASSRSASTRRPRS